MNTTGNRQGEEEQWEFFRDRCGNWKWIRKDRDGITVGSAEKGFADRDECIAHAIQSGYQQTKHIFYFPGLPDEEVAEMVSGYSCQGAINAC